MPNQPNHFFSPSQETLFGLLAHGLFGKPFSPEENTNWIEVYGEAYAHTVNLPAFYKSAAYGMPEELIERVRMLLRRQAMADTVIHIGHTAIHTLLTSKHIPYVILKGAASAYYYQDPFLRGMGDVDFYVPEEYFGQAEEILKEKGFEVREIESDHHTVLYKSGVKYELHSEIPGIPKERAGEIIRRYRADLVDSAILTNTESSVFYRPSPFHHGLILLLHTQQHLLNEGLGLRHVCDWAVFVASFEDGEFPTVFQEKLTAVGLWTFARILSLVAVTAVGLPKAAWMEERRGDESLARDLLLDFLDGGNFGYKDEDRSRVYEGMLISNQDKSRIRRSRIGNAFESVNGWVRHKWPAAKKCPLLLPFGWIYFVIRRMWLVITGKKQSIDIRRTLQNSGNRQRLYSKLDLFRIK